MGFPNGAYRIEKIPEGPNTMTIQDREESLGPFICLLVGIAIGTLGGVAMTLLAFLV